MKTYFKKNETTQCECMEQKATHEIFCFYCANYWASNVGKYHLPFQNSNNSVDWMNAMHNDLFGEEYEKQMALARGIMEEDREMLAKLAGCPCS